MRIFGKLIGLSLIVSLCSSTVPAIAGMSVYSTYAEAAKKAERENDFREAERLYRKTLEICEQGDDESAKNNMQSDACALVDVLFKEGKEGEAIKVLTKLIATPHRDIYGQSHLYRYLAKLRIYESQYSQAEKDLKKADALRTKEKMLSSFSTVMLDVMKAICADNAGRKTEAESRLKTIIEEAKKKSHSGSPPDTAKMAIVAAWLDKNGFRGSSEIIWWYLTNKKASKYGWQHAKTVEAACNFADCALSNDAGIKAIAIVNKCMSKKPEQKVRLKLLEWKLDNSSQLERQKIKLEKTAKFELLKEALSLSEKQRGLTNEKTDQLRYKLLGAYKKSGQMGEREQLMRMTVAKVEKKHGAESVECGDMLLTLAYFCYGEKPKKSIPVLDRAIKIFEKSKKPMGSIQVSTMLTAQAKNMQKVGRYDDSDKLFKRAIAIFEKVKYEQPLLMVLPKYEKMLKKAGRKDQLALVSKRYKEIYNRHKDACGNVAFGAGPEVTSW